MQGARFGAKYKLSMTRPCQSVPHLLTCVVLASAAFFPMSQWLRSQHSIHAIKYIYYYDNRIKQGNTYTVQLFKILNQYISLKTPVVNVVQITKIYSFKYQNILNFFDSKFSKIFHNLPKVKNGMMDKRQYFLTPEEMIYIGLE